MFTFFSTDTQNNPQVQGDNISNHFLLLMLSTLLLSPFVAAQRGGGGFHGGGGHGGGSHGGGYSGGGGDCDVSCLVIVGIVSGIVGIPLMVCFIYMLSMACGNKKQMDNSLVLNCPYNNPEHWLTNTDVTIPMSTGNMSNEYSDLIEHLKLNPSMLNLLWEGKYIDSGLVGTFNPKLFFYWNHKKNSMEFKTVEDERDDYGHYRIINGMFNFENNRFVAHKVYFNPSQQSVPYTIVQAGYIEFASKNDQICLMVNGSWYSTYDNSVKGTFEYNKMIEDVTLKDKYESYGTFA